MQCNLQGGVMPGCKQLQPDSLADFFLGKSGVYMYKVLFDEMLWLNL